MASKRDYRKELVDLVSLEEVREELGVGKHKDYNPEQDVNDALVDIYRSQKLRKIMKQLAYPVHLFEWWDEHKNASGITVVDNKKLRLDPDNYMVVFSSIGTVPVRVGHFSCTDGSDLVYGEEEIKLAERLCDTGYFDTCTSREQVRVCLARTIFSASTVRDSAEG
ncbi:hypothetical protein HY501_02225 [Candidatus Woesearchaeota archaeon]|nr:hypothetical protein [Candidatus Woesearchaeota archaeon]